MKVIFCSDLHANIEALKAFENLINTFETQEIIVLGDFVGYNANPEEVINVFRIWEKEERLVGKVGGNHDLALCDDELLGYFNMVARSALIWAREQLSDESKEWLAALPDRGKLNSSTVFCHGSYRNPNEYILNDHLAFQQFLAMPQEIRIVFFGHTHVPVIYELTEEMRLNVHWMDNEGEYPLNPKCRYLINPGSIGQPRNKDPRLSFIVYDTDTELVKYYKKEYDISRTQAKIIESGLPEVLAHRLAEGW